MEKKSRKEFKELSEEQLKEVTGGGYSGGIIQIMTCVTLVTNNPCPGKRLDPQCHCID